jgi:hypothetical protein
VLISIPLTIQNQCSYQYYSALINITHLCCKCNVRFDLTNEESVKATCHEGESLLGCPRILEVISTYETSVSFYETTWRNIPEDILCVKAFSVFPVLPRTNAEKRLKLVRHHNILDHVFLSAALFNRR